MERIAVIRILIVVISCIWISAYMHYSIKDRLSCDSYGVKFGGESIMLDGYCLYGTVKVPVEWYMRK